MCLERPSHIGRCDKHYSNPARAGRSDQLVDGPVLHYDTQRQHEDAQCPVYDRGRDVIAEALP
jgi:hypothetical protein